jgi:hypothetical protein
VHDRLLREFLSTRYEAAGAVARIGKRSAEIDRLLVGLGVRSGAFVSAWNPLSRRMPDGWNQRMQARLAERLRHLPIVEGSGTGRGWRERHFLVGADCRRVQVLARRFRQLATVLVIRSQPARLRFLRW